LAKCPDEAVAKKLNVVIRPVSVVQNWRQPFGGLFEFIYLVLFEMKNNFEYLLRPDGVSTFYLRNLNLP